MKHEFKRNSISEGVYNIVYKINYKIKTCECTFNYAAKPL